MTSKEEIQSKIGEFARIQPWNHNFQLPFGIETSPGEQKSHGKNLVKYDRLAPLFDKIDVAGKRILDVGCNEGFFAFSLRDLGATVTGIDADEHRISKARYIREVLSADRVEFENLDIYSDEFERLERFDLCLCLGFLHRVPEPFRAISALCRKSEIIVFEWKALKFGPHDDAFAYFSEKEVDRANFYGTEYWLLSFAAVERMLRRNGFSHFHRIDDATQRRAILVAGREPAPIFAEPDIVRSRNRVRSLLSHTKRYVKTVYRILSGSMNA